MTERDALQVLAGEVLGFFEFVDEALKRDEKTGQPSIFERELRKDLGLATGAAGGAGGAALPAEGLDAVRAYRDAANPGAEAGMQAIADIAVCLDALIGTVESFFPEGDFEAGPGLQQLVHSAIDVLGANYVRLRWPRLFLLFQLAGVIEEISSTYGPGSNSGSRFGRSLWALLGFLFRPGKALEQLDPGTEATSDTAAAISDFSVRVIAIIVAWLDQEHGRGEKDIEAVTDVLTGWDGPGLDIDSPVTPTRADVISQRMTSIAFGDEPGGPSAEPSTSGRLVVTTAVVPKSEGGTALFLALGGRAERQEAIGDRWTFSAKIRSEAGVAALLGSQYRLVGPGNGEGLEASVAFISHSPARSVAEPTPSQVSFSFPSPSGSRLDLGQVAFSLSLAPSGAEMLLTLADAALVIDARDNDGLIAELLGKTPLRLPFGLVLGYSTARGLVLEGSVSREGTPAGPNAPLSGPGNTGAPVIAATIPVGRAFGPLTVHEVGLRIARGPADAAPQDQTLLRVEADLSFSAHVGPVYLRLEQLGVHAAVDSGLPPEKRNLRFVDLRLGAKFPRGIAVNIETALVAGGGAILHDPDQGLYFGVFDLALRGGTSVKAIGLISTRNPDGSKGFSFLLILTLELARPWPLGMGFFLEGFGGMIAVHRTFDVAAMRAALPTGQLRNVLFPADPVHRAAELLSALQRIFPARRGTYLGGLLAKIGWAEPTLVRMELAVILEWSEFGPPDRIIILGRVSAILPRPDEAIIRLNMDAVGVLDFDAGTFELDAVLYDSRLCGRFPISGAMAMRMAWQGMPGFALAVGGLHPEFRAPPGFPTVARLQLALTQGDNPSLICRAYFAVTSNTVQFGADCSLHAAAFGFSITGNVGFDVLIQLLPFHFLAAFRASVQLKRGSKNLFKVSVAGELEGPLPLRLAGKATFEILWCDFSVKFDKTLVDGGVPNDVVRIDVLAELLVALSQPRAWQAQLPAGLGQLVTLRLPATDGVLLHPLGTLTVRQTVVPLGLSRDIDRVGTGTPGAARRFAITQAAIGPANQSRDPVHELFAPAQFFDMSDDEKLAAPSFEAMQAGVALGAAGYAFDFAACEASPFDYTDIAIGPDGKPVLEPEPHEADGAQVLVLMAVSAAGTARMRRSLEHRFEAPVLAAAPRLARSGWAPVELGAAPPAEAAMTWVEARALAPDRGRSVVVPRSELVN